MLSPEEQKWADSTDEQLESIAQSWANKFDTKTMRTFQYNYLSRLNDLPELNDAELKGELTDNSILHMALINRHSAMTRAIDIKEFEK
jgi:hypothetical protein